MKGGGLDVDEMKASKEKKESDMVMKLKEKDIVEVIEEKKDIEPDENMKGYFSVEIIKLGGGEQKDLLSNMVGTLGDGLNFGAKFGTKILKETVGKVAPLNNVDQEFFAIKN